MDEQGRMIDEHGNIINLKHKKELLINTKTQHDTRTRDLQQMMKSAKQNL
jgi:hypothetical protein